IPSDSTVPSAGIEQAPAQPPFPFSRSGCTPALLPGYSPLAGSLYPQIVSFGLAGHVSAVWPLGLAWPSRMRAVDVPPSWPANHIASRDLTLPTQGVTTGFWLLTTTIVFGFAAATAVIRLTFAGESCRTAETVDAVPSGFGALPIASLSLTNTIALLFPAAAAAASAMSPATRV